MTLSPLDHVIALLLVAVFPVVDYFYMRGRAARIHAGETNLRLEIYEKILREEWIGAVMIAGAWFSLGRSAGELGLAPEFGARAWLGYGLTALLGVAYLVQYRMIRGNAKHVARVREQLGFMSFLMPHTLPERRVFDGVSFTAGVCEELVFRGYLIAYLTALAGTSFWVAALASSASFGIAHLYQGPSGVLKSGGFGLSMAALYWLTGSIWAPVLAHAWVDLVSGRLGYAALSTEGPQGATPQLGTATSTSRRWSGSS